MSKLFCKKCGTEAKSNDLVCRACGEPISWDAEKVSGVGHDRVPGNGYKKPRSTITSKLFRTKNERYNAAPQARFPIPLHVVAGVVLALVVVLAVCLIVLPKLQNDGQDRKTNALEQYDTSENLRISESSGEEETASSVSESPSNSFTKAQNPHFTKVEASSTLSSGLDGDSYEPQNAVDGDTLTVWSEGASGNGEGEWIRMLADEPQKVRGVSLLAGNTKTRDICFANGRPCDVTLELSDGYTQEAKLEDLYGEWQSVAFGAEHETTSITIVINSVYPGSANGDASFTELMAF